MIPDPSVPLPRPVVTQNASDEDDSGSETEREESRVTVARPKGETADERKARKGVVKAERSVSLPLLYSLNLTANDLLQARRAEKKAHKATFSDERRKQLASRTKIMANGRAADIAVGQRGVVSLR